MPSIHRTPVVLLKNGTVVRVTLKNFDQVAGNVEKILFLGDLLISFGDFLYTSKPLSPSGYVEEWWSEDLKRAIDEDFGDFEQASKSATIPKERLEALIAAPFEEVPAVGEAMLLSQRLECLYTQNSPSFGVRYPLVDEVMLLKNWLSVSEVVLQSGLVYRITGAFDEGVVRALRTIYAPHQILDGQVVLRRMTLAPLHFLWSQQSKVIDQSEGPILNTIRLLSGVTVRDKFPTFVWSANGKT